MSKQTKHFWYYVITIVYFAVFSVTFNVGIINNPNFNIHDFCMGFASELAGLIFAIIIVENYIRMRTARTQEKKLEKSVNKEPDLTQSGFEVIGGKGIGSIMNVSTMRDKRTGVQYLLVIHENGCGLTPLLDEDGRPIKDEQTE